MNQDGDKRGGSRGTSEANTDRWRQRTAFVGFDWAVRIDFRWPYVYNVRSAGSRDGHDEVS